MTKPNFFVIGAPKCGTTSLYEYFTQSPDVFLSEKKELHFFSLPFLQSCSNGPGDKYVLKEIPNSEEKYLSRFLGAERKVIADISPSYINFPVAERIKSFSPQAKVVVMLRNPVKKAFSQYSHLFLEGRETLSFEEALSIESERHSLGYSDFWLYKDSSLYYEKVKHFKDVFGENLKVILFEDFIRNPKDTIDELCDWLEIPSFEFNDDGVHNQSGAPHSVLVSRFLLGHNFLTWIARRVIPNRLGKFIRGQLISLNTGSKSTIDSQVERSLKQFFKEDIKRLEGLIGKRTGWYD